VVNFKPWESVEPDTRVRVNQTGNLANLNGKTGVVIRTLTGGDPRRKRVVLYLDGRMTTSYTSHLERIEMAYVTNLVGPKPEPAKEPTHPTPWTSDGANIIDANGNVVTRVQFGGYRQGSYRSEQPMATKYELARVIAEAVSKFYEVKAEDAQSPF
jgi:hypothetical protein